MGFASGSLTVRRFYLAGAHPDEWTDAWLAALQAHAFGRHGVVEDNGIETGWIRPTHLFDTDFSVSDRLQVDRFIHLAMRIDRTAPPPAIVRAYRRIEETKMLEASDRPFLTRGQKQEARESAIGRADDEARQGAFRRASGVEVLIDLGDGCAYLASTSSAAGETAAALFDATFDLALIPATSDEVAFRRIEKQSGHVRAFEESSPLSLVEPPSDEAEFQAAGFAIGSRAYLGRAFLTWLWYLADSAEGLCPTQGGGDVEFTIHRAMHLDCDWGLSGTTAVRTDAPARCPDARAALGSGKQPTKMGLLIEHDHEAWSLTLDGPAWTVSGLKLPDSDERDPVVRTEERCLSLRRLTHLLDGMFEAFLQRRLSAGWKKQHANMVAWASRQRPSPPADTVRLVM